MPKISVIMPAYNAERTLAEAIESILSQEFGDLEIIIIDDGSSDGTGKIIERYAKSDSRVKKLTNNFNQGIAPSRNRGLVSAQGTYIACLDSDDIAEPQRLGEQLRIMEENPEYVLLGSDLTIIDERSGAIGRRIYPYTDADLRRSMTRLNPFAQPASMFSAEVARQIGGYREDLLVCEDYDLFLRLAEKGKIANINNALTRYRISSRQTKSEHLRQTILCTLQVQRSALARGWQDPLLNKIHRMLLSCLLILPNCIVLFAFKKLTYQSQDVNGSGCN